MQLCSNNIFSLCFQNKLISQIINLDKLKHFISNDVDNNKDFISDLDIKSLLVCPKKAEWFLLKSIEGSSYVGSGNYPVDIEFDNYGIDAGVVSFNDSNKLSNIKSIMSTTKNKKNIDELFINHNTDGIIQLYKNTLIDKYKKYDNILYILFFTYLKDIYVVSLFLNKKNIDNIKFLTFINDKNIVIDNVIDPFFGRAKINSSNYKMELQLHKNIIDYSYKIT